MWRSEERDAYTLSSSFASSVDVDHVLEIQLASYARLDDPGVLPITREVFNGSDNLNVTSKRVNQKRDLHRRDKQIAKERRLFERFFSRKVRSRGKGTVVG